MLNSLGKVCIMSVQQAYLFTLQGNHVRSGSTFFYKRRTGKNELIFLSWHWFSSQSVIWQRELRGIGNNKRNQLPKEASADTIYKDESD